MIPGFRSLLFRAESKRLTFKRMDRRIFLTMLLQQGAVVDSWCTGLHFLKVPTGMSLALRNIPPSLSLRTLRAACASVSMAVEHDTSALQIAADFESGATVFVDGWVFSEAELRIFARQKHVA